MLKHILIGTTAATLIALSATNSASARVPSDADYRGGSEQKEVIVTVPGHQKQPKSKTRSKTGGTIGDGECRSDSGAVVPCKTSLGQWSSIGQCYGGPLEPQPPAGDPIWGGQTTGSIWMCAGQHQTFRHPSGTTPTVPPIEIAKMAVDSMQLRGIGIVRTPLNGGTGLVGLPMWVWGKGISANNCNSTECRETWGPNTASATATGVTVTAVASVDAVAFNWGDGNSKTCNNLAKRYERAYDLSPSPACGHTYSEKGTYTIEAASSWTVKWSGGGQSGTIPLTTTSTEPVRIGELQVVS